MDFKTKKDAQFNEFFMIFTKIMEDYCNPSIKQPKRGDLTKKGISIINFVGFRKQCYIKEIVERFKISPSTASEHIEHLNRANYIFKHFHKKDKRKVMISLTDKGLLLFHQFNEKKYYLLRGRFLKLNKEDANNLIESLIKFSQIAQL